MTEHLDDTTVTAAVEVFGSRVRGVPCALDTPELSATLAAAAGLDPTSAGGRARRLAASLVRRLEADRRPRVARAGTVLRRVGGLRR